MQSPPITADRSCRQRFNKTMERNGWFALEDQKTIRPQTYSLRYRGR